MKNEIINFVMGMLHNIWIKDWPYEPARDFCKRILDSEGIDYQEENFHRFSFGYDPKKTPEIVKKYAEMYKDTYQDNDQEKTIEMEKIIETCNKIKKLDDGFYNELHDIFNDTIKDSKPEKDITIKRGEAIRFSNGAYSNISPNDFEKLMNITFSEEQEEPFTINFGVSVPPELREEVINRVTPILEEVRSKMEKGKVK